MNKLEEIYRVAADKSTVEQQYERPYLSEDLFIDEAKQITTDVAVKFAEWVNSHSEFYKKLDSYEKLFEEFINNHYGK